VCQRCWKHTYSPRLSIDGKQTLCRDCMEAELEVIHRPDLPCYEYPPTKFEDSFRATVVEESERS